MYQKVFKRLIDILVSLCATLMLLPLILVIIIAVKLDSPGPVFFTQKRMGMNKKLFSILKFRTMKTDTPRYMPTHMLQHPEQHITRVGKHLRRSSLDELPQIFNILAGQMSLIGPRPALWNQYDLIAERDKYGANNVRPGLSGWAQINGRDELCIADKARLDGEYVKIMSLAFDFKCFFRTIIAVFKGTGIIEGASVNWDSQSGVPDIGKTDKTG